MIRPDAKVEKSIPTPSPWTSENPFDGLAALVDLDIKVAPRADTFPNTVHSRLCHSRPAPSL